METNHLRRIALTVLLFIVLGLTLAACTPQSTVTVSVLPDKTEYVLGEDLSLAGGVLKIVTGERTAEIRMESDGVSYSGYDPNKLGKQSVTVSYSYFERVLTAAFDVTVSAPEKKATGLRIVPPDRSHYVEHETLDLSGLIVFVLYEDGTESVVSGGYGLSCSGALTLEDSGAVEVTYLNFSVTFYITVAAREIVAMEFLRLPQKSRYFAGESPDLTDAEIVYRYNDGSTESVAMDTELIVITPAIFRYHASQVDKITVSDGKFEVNFEVSVEKRNIAVDASDRFRAAAEQIAATPERNSVYAGAYLSIENVLPTDSVVLDGEDFRFDGSDPNDPNQKPGYAYSVRVDNVSNAFPVFNIRKDEAKIEIHCYALAARGKRVVFLETEEEIYAVTLFLTEPDIYRIQNGAISFVEDPHMLFAAHFIRWADAGVAVSVAMSYGAEGGTQYADCPAGFDDFTVVWRGSTLSAPVTEDFPSGTRTSPPSLPTSRSDGAAAPPQIPDRPRGSSPKVRRTHM